MSENVYEIPEDDITHGQDLVAISDNTNHTLLDNVTRLWHHLWKQEDQLEHENWASGTSWSLLATQVGCRHLNFSKFLFWSGVVSRNCIFQGVLLALIAATLVFWVVWAIWVRKRSNSPTVVDALKKLSNPPDKNFTRSKSILKRASVIGHPQSSSSECQEDTLQYLDLEAGHRRLSRLSFGSSDGVPTRLSRISVGSCESCSSRRSTRVSFSSDSSSRKSSRSSRNSRVSFEYIRRLSSNTLDNLKSSSNNSYTNEVSPKAPIFQQMRKNGAKSVENSGRNFNFEPEKRLAGLEEEDYKDSKGTSSVCYLEEK